SSSTDNADVAAIIDQATNRRKRVATEIEDSQSADKDEVVQLAADDESNAPSTSRTVSFSSAAPRKKQKTYYDTMLYQGLQRSEVLYKERTEMKRASRENECLLKLAQDNERLVAEKELWEKDYQFKVNQA
ncbi:hypothetical protein A0J61_11801, partial [Choanephora cucurbitarum]